MNKSEKAVVTSVLENIYASAQRDWKTGDAKAWANFGKRLETSAKDGCHTVMKLIESNNGNETVIMNTLLFLERNDMLDKDWELSEVVDTMKNELFDGE